MGVLQRLYSKDAGEISLAGIEMRCVCILILSMFDKLAKNLRCDSYNTVQLQLLGGPEVEARSPQVPDSPRIEHSNDISRPSSRGRLRQSNHVRQPTVSAPPSALIMTRDILESTSWPSPRSRYAHSLSPEGTQFTPSGSPLSANSDPEDSMETDEEEVDFWGGESPRSRISSPVCGREGAVDGDSIDGDEEEDDDDDEDDSEDEEMSDDDAEEDEADDYNRMDFLGHR